MLQTRVGNGVPDTTKPPYPEPITSSENSATSEEHYSEEHYSSTFAVRCFLRQFTQKDISSFPSYYCSDVLAELLAGNYSPSTSRIWYQLANVVSVMDVYDGSSLFHEGFYCH